MRTRSIPYFSSLVVVALSMVLAGCDDSSPTEPTPTSVAADIVYHSSVTPGDSVQAGFCAHHMLGSSWIQLWIDGAAADSVQLRALEGPKTWTGRAEELPIGEPLVAVIQDLECCSHDDPCQPTELLLINGVALHNVVEVSDAAGSRPGLAFRMGSRGTVVQ